MLVESRHDFRILLDPLATGEAVQVVVGQSDNLESSVHTCQEDIAFSLEGRVKLCAPYSTSYIDGADWSKGITTIEDPQMRVVRSYSHKVGNVRGEGDSRHSSIEPIRELGHLTIARVVTFCSPESVERRLSDPIAST